MKRSLAALIALFCLPALSAVKGNPVNVVVEGRIDRFVEQMSLEEKVKMIGGNEFSTFPNERLGIPSLHMTDGPLGVRNGKNTAFPSGLSMAASFDPLLVKDVAAAIADEARLLGKHILLGPCVNITRQPFGGRNFESFGEDPHLSSVLAADYVRGIQGQNVLASVKHFALNEQEHERMTVDVHADVRTMFEMHFPAFQSAVDAGVWTVMSSYNRVNGHYATASYFLQTTVLKEMWGFQGLVVSDWGATHDTVGPANAGMDLEMPTGLHWDQKLIDAVHAGFVRETTIDDKIRRILRTMFAIGLIAPENVKPAPAPIGPGTPEHDALALKMAQDSIVLLKNEENILPLKNLKSLAVIGPNADFLNTGGGGSSHVEPISNVTPLEGLRQRLGRLTQVRYAVGALHEGQIDLIPTSALKPSLDSRQTGLKVEFFDNAELAGAPALERVDQVVNFDRGLEAGFPLKGAVSARWSGILTPTVSDRFQIQTVTEGGVRVFIDDKEVISNWDIHYWALDTYELSLEAGRTYRIRLELRQPIGGVIAKLGWNRLGDHRLQEAIRLARDADAAVIFAGISDMHEGEGYDRPTLNLAAEQVELIKKVSEVNPRTIVVLTAGGQFLMAPWLGNAKALLQMWYPGQEGGRAIADLLLGHVNPSAKLPVSFLKRWEDSPAYGNYPGENGKVEYKEGIFIGYRHLDRGNIAPEFEFGFGLSYTQFQFSDLTTQVSPNGVHVQFTVQNIGTLEGAEVAQLYVTEMNPTLPRPPKELKGFKKVVLKPGESARVMLTLDRSAFSYFDAESMSWKMNAGAFRLQVGSSSRQIKMMKDLDLPVFH